MWHGRPVCSVLGQMGLELARARTIMAVLQLLAITAGHQDRTTKTFYGDSSAGIEILWEVILTLIPKWHRQEGTKSEFGQ